MNNSIKVQLYSPYSFWGVDFLVLFSEVYQPKCLSNGNKKKKNNRFVEANVRNNSAKFQVYPPHSFWGIKFMSFERSELDINFLSLTTATSKFVYSTYCVILVSKIRWRGLWNVDV